MTLLFCIELQGGLANRLRALWSAHVFAQRHRRPVLVLWPIAPELGCSYRQLFSLHSPLILIDLHLERRLDRLLLRLLRQLFSSFGFGLNKPVEPGQPWGAPPRFAPRWMPFQWIQTCAEFESTTKQDPPFRPNGVLQQQAQTRLAEARRSGRPLIGVHIRRSDHRLASATSQTSAFIEAMQQQLLKAPDTHFLLCTDEPTEAAQLKAVFGERLFWWPPQSLDRSQQQAATAAMLDFLALAGCDAILGSYLSSFGLLAARYGGVPLTIAGAVQPTPAG